jgi:RNA polymerase sigma factor (sigma-70 family)
MNSEGKRYCDSDIWKKFQGGDKKAFTLLFKKYSPLLNHYGCKAFFYSDVVEDCIQDLFIYLWKNKKTLGDVINVKYYLITCLRRKLLNHKDILKREKALFQMLTEEGIYQDKPPEELSSLQKDENIFLKINREIQNLPDRQKEAFILRYLKQKSYDEITLIMNVNYQSSRKYVYKALLALKNKFLNINETVQVKRY